MALNERGCYLTLPVADGRLIDIVPLFGGRARVAITDDPGHHSYGDVW